MIVFKTKVTEREMMSTYNYYSGLCDRIPDYLLRNLKEMPNNKGYIWRGIYMYGELNREVNSEKTTLFEKTDRDVMLIHEWSKNEYKIFEKIGKDPKRLIEKRVINKKS